MLHVGKLPYYASDAPHFVLHALTNIKVFGGLAFAVLAAVMWIGAVSLSDISFAYPFMGLAIVLVLALSPLFFGEVVPLSRWIGVLVVCLGIVIAARKW